MKNRGRSLEGSCQEGRAIFFIFFCQAIHIANAATSCALDFTIFGCSLQCSAPDTHLDQGRSGRKSLFKVLKINHLNKPSFFLSPLAIHLPQKSYGSIICPGVMFSAVAQSPVPNGSYYRQNIDTYCYLLACFHVFMVFCSFVFNFYLVSFQCLGYYNHC
jgi:hypothetical protein